MTARETETGRSSTQRCWTRGRIDSCRTKSELGSETAVASAWFAKCEVRGARCEVPHVLHHDTSAGHRRSARSVAPLLCPPVHTAISRSTLPTPTHTHHTADIAVVRPCSFFNRLSPPSFAAALIRPPPSSHVLPQCLAVLARLPRPRSPRRGPGQRFAQKSRLRAFA